MRILHMTKNHASNSKTYRFHTSITSDKNVSNIMYLELYSCAFYPSKCYFYEYSVVAYTMDLRIS